MVDRSPSLTQLTPLTLVWPAFSSKARTLLCHETLHRWRADYTHTIDIPRRCALLAAAVSDPRITCSEVCHFIQWSYWEDCTSWLLNDSREMPYGASPVTD